MSWRTTLEERRGATLQKGSNDALTKLTQPQKEQSDVLTKLTKLSSVGFVSAPSGHFENIEVATTLDLSALEAGRARLLALTVGECIDPAHIRWMLDPDLAEWLSLDDSQCIAFLHLLADTADRHAGHLPKADTAAMHCRSCGPVWVHPSIAAALPRVEGWASGLGCPWCFVRKDGRSIPRPAVTCGGCRYYMPDGGDRKAGSGTCVNGHGSHLPTEAHVCAAFSISGKGA